MKLKVILILVIFSAVLHHALPQNMNDTIKEKKSINEISYQFPLAFGYSHIWNMNDKFLLGAGFHLGYGRYWPPYSDFFLFKIYTRNVFSSNKINHKWDYDIGLFTSISFQYEAIYYGLISSGYINIGKFKIGMNLLFGAAKVDNINNEFLFPRVTLAPSLVYKF